MIDDKKLDDLYQDFFDLINKKSIDHDPEAIAAILMTQSLQLYKTLMSEQDYNNIVDNIIKLKNKVRSFDSIIQNFPHQLH